MQDKERVYAALGRMVTAFQSLEGTLSQHLVLLLNSKTGSAAGQLAQAAVATMPFKVLCQLAALLPTLYSVDRLGATSAASRKCLAVTLAVCEAQLKEGLKLASEVEARRNQLIHSLWYIDERIVNPPGVLTRVKTTTTKGRLKVTAAHESVVAIEETRQQARKAQELIGMALQGYKINADFDWEPPPVTGNGAQ